MKARLGTTAALVVIAITGSPQSGSAQVAVNGRAVTHEEVAGTTTSNIISVNPSSTAILITRGANLTINPGVNYFSRATFTCPSIKGCLVVADANISINGTAAQYKVCSHLDDKPLSPDCVLQPGFTGRGFQSSRTNEVASGVHTVRTAVVVTGVTGVLQSWQVVYYVYGL